MLKPHYLISDHSPLSRGSLMTCFSNRLLPYQTLRSQGSLMRHMWRKPAHQPHVIEEPKSLDPLLLTMTAEVAPVERFAPVGKMQAVSHRWGVGDDLAF